MFSLCVRLRLTNFYQSWWMWGEDSIWIEISSRHASEMKSWFENFRDQHRSEFCIWNWIIFVMFSCILFLFRCSITLLFFVNHDECLRDSDKRFLLFAPQKLFHDYETKGLTSFWIFKFGIESSLISFFLQFDDIRFQHNFCYVFVYLIFV